jgi:hypothetical protein
MLVSSFDYVVCCLLASSMLVLRIYRPAWRPGCLLSLLLFGLGLPLLSQEVEFRLHPQPSETFDAFTMAYTLLKFPLYWAIGVLHHVSWRWLVKR